ncbi:hypothetical protein BKA61DRAFT_652864 [Leptodontidium sp. MPI-SDFR-AT-0119]|nr:hypothetical protein BKA61DRAFT_652864 [Leptodontidium sp. MPI-SDFR-AT-0119]
MVKFCEDGSLDTSVKSLHWHHESEPHSKPRSGPRGPLSFYHSHRSRRPRISNPKHKFRGCCCLTPRLTCRQEEHVNKRQSLMTAAKGPQLTAPAGLRVRQTGSPYHTVLVYEIRSEGMGFPHELVRLWERGPGDKHHLTPLSPDQLKSSFVMSMIKAMPLLKYHSCHTASISTERMSINMNSSKTLRSNFSKRRDIAALTQAEQITYRKKISQPNRKKKKKHRFMLEAAAEQDEIC